MFGFFKRSEPQTEIKNLKRSYPANFWKSAKRSFFSAEQPRVLENWVTDSAPIDYYLASELPLLRARSREAVKRNSYAKRFISLIKANIVGPDGVLVQAQTKDFSGKLDKRANDAIEKAFGQWCSKKNCDFTGKNSFFGLQNIAISSAARDGQFLFRIHENVGEYGLQLQILDPNLLDVTRNTKTDVGGEIRLGVEYDKNGKITRYHFRKRDMFGYQLGERYSLSARVVLHGFIPEYEDQSQGIPWMHAALEDNKHLEKYDESAIVAARAGAMKGGIISGGNENQYEGDEEGSGRDDGYTYQNLKAGSTIDIGDREFSSYDPSYPHQMYKDFTKQTLRRISSGIGISYHSLSNDLEGVNYSSIRAGVLEDREIFKGLQNWFIDQLIAPVYKLFIQYAYMKGALVLPSGARLNRGYNTYYAVAYQPRRWPWVDPLKDEQANQFAYNNRTKSRSQIIREQGKDPDEVFNEIAFENERMRELGITPSVTSSNPKGNEDEKENEDENNE